MGAFVNVWSITQTNNRVACGLVDLSAGICRYCARTRRSSAAGGTEPADVIMAA
jgi:hypothetical protein